MPKCKTSKTAAKRFKLTGTGKIRFECSHLNHLMSCKKDGGRARRMRAGGEVCKGDMDRVRRLLPNGL